MGGRGGRGLRGGCSVRQGRLGTQRRLEWEAYPRQLSGMPHILWNAISSNFSVQLFFLFFLFSPIPRYILTITITKQIL